MRKTLIILAILLIVGAVAAAVYFYFNGHQGAAVPGGGNGGGSASASTSTDEGAIPAPTGPMPTGNTFDIQTPAGAVTVNNFYQGQQDVSTDTPALTLADTDSYSIWYFRGDSSFEIDLTDPSSTDALLVAENDFISRLGISQADACKLTVRVDAPYDRGTENGSIGPLSFCASPVGGGFQQ